MLEFVLVLLEHLLIFTRLLLVVLLAVRILFKLYFCYLVDEFYISLPKHNRCAWFGFFLVFCGVSCLGKVVGHFEGRRRLGVLVVVTMFFVVVSFFGLWSLFFLSRSNIYTLLRRSRAGAPRAVTIVSIFLSPSPFLRHSRCFLDGSV